MTLIAANKSSMVSLNFDLHKDPASLCFCFARFQASLKGSNAKKNANILVSQNRDKKNHAQNFFFETLFKLEKVKSSFYNI